MKEQAGSLDVLCMGETMALLVAHELGSLAQVQNFSKRIAGADSNVAIGLSRLGLRVGWISRIGADSFGAYIQNTLAAEGIDTSQLKVDATRCTGFMLKARSAGGNDPAIEYYRRGSAASQLAPSDLPLPYAMKARHIHATGITPALSPSAHELILHAMQTMKAAGRSVSFDPNLRPGLWPDTQTMRETVNNLARYADWVLPGIEEGRLLTGQNEPADIAQWYLDRGSKAVIIKQGAQGAYFQCANGQRGQAAGVAVETVVDTVGAGDAFAVGIISARLEGLDWPQALHRANWIASRAIQVIGDMEGLPTRAELLTQYQAPAT